MAFRINWKRFNWCAECNHKQLKSKGYFCLLCHKLIRTKPRRKTYSNNEIMVVRY